MIGLLLLLLAAMMFAVSAEAATPTHGRVRIYGIKDEFHKPRNMFAPYAVFKDEFHVEDRYLEFFYTKLGSNERCWTVYIVDGEGNIQNGKGSRIELYLPYPSIWSAAQGEYWKWTKTYAQKHYDWRWARGLIVGQITVESELTGSRYQLTRYIREDYRPVKDMENFGVCITLPVQGFMNGLAFFVEFGGGGTSGGGEKRFERISPDNMESGDFYKSLSNMEEMTIPEGVVSYGKQTLSYGWGNRQMTKLKRIIWPKSLKDGSYFAQAAPNLKEIRYMGSEEEWKETDTVELFKDVKKIFNYKP